MTQQYSLLINNSLEQSQNSLQSFPRTPFQHRAFPSLEWYYIMLLYKSCTFSEYERFPNDFVAVLSCESP